MPLTIGDTFAGYRVLRLLGSGGMGEVYLVQHPRLPRQEALKVLRADFSQDESFRERFIREADLASGLRHPHIVGIHDRGEYDGQLWIAMDYIDGADLSHLLARRYPQGMPVGHVLPIVTAVASALDYAHRKGLLHRDVKPANIIVSDLDTADPKVFLADFGIARPLDDTSGITTTNMTVGTVAYAAPEQLMGEDVDGRADQYALAATTFHLLAGLQPFSHSNPAVVISHHLSSEPPKVSHTHSELHRLDGVLRRGLAKKPETRYFNCADFGQALARGARSEATDGTTHLAPRAEPVKTGTKLDITRGGPRSTESLSRTTIASAADTRDDTQSTVWDRHAIAISAVSVVAIVVSVAVVLAVVYADRSPEPQDLGRPAPAPTYDSSALPAPPATTSNETPTSTAMTPTETQPPQENGYALTACHTSQYPPMDRPASAELIFCASGGLRLQDLSWTSWGREGADGSGIAIFKVCEPNCAEGPRVPTSVTVRAWNPQPASPGSRCPSSFLYFADIILAFPMSLPPTGANMPPTARYKGMPALHLTSSKNVVPPAQSMGQLSCY